jgi:hypothetical protein
VRKMSPALAGKCIAVAVACAELAAEPKMVWQQTSFPTKHRVELEGGGNFWSERYCPVCPLSSRCWEQGSNFAESWRLRL